MPTPPPHSAPPPSSRPPFTALPLHPTGPPLNAWFLHGTSDELGTLNLLTPATVAAAAKEIRTGRRVSLDWPLDRPKWSCHGREGLKHDILQRGEEGKVVNDDVVRFNTQGSSQWDGGRHYGYLKERRYYNNTTHEQLHASRTLGIDAWASAGGITGRGVLLDYYTWATTHSIPISALTATAIPLAHLRRLMADYRIALQPGDILFLRSGFTHAYEALSPAEQQALAQRPRAEFIGVEPTEGVLAWLWDSGVAAVAGDAPAWERSPLGGLRAEEFGARLSLHQVLLGGWGMPIGEMLDLEGLAEECGREGRWSFFVCSVPLKIPGGVASPPNAVAIF